MEIKEIKRRKRTYKASNPTKVIKDGWCHQCKMKQPEVIACVNFWKSKKDNKCGGKYCSKCIEKHYQQSFNQLTEMDRWICFSCDQKCSCAVCKRKRGSYSMKKRQYTHKKNRLTKEIGNGQEMQQQCIPIRYDINPSCNSYPTYNTFNPSYTQSYNQSYNSSYNSSSCQSFKQQAIYIHDQQITMNNEPNNFYIYQRNVQSMPINPHLDQYPYASQQQLSYFCNELNDIPNQHPQSIYVYQDTLQSHPTGNSPPKSDLSYIINHQDSNPSYNYTSMENDHQMGHDNCHHINPPSSDQKYL